jgi:diguanylate cyclase (GGDEF)-like protein
VLAGLGWAHLFVDLDRSRRDAIEATDKRVRAFAEVYSRHVRRSVNDVDRVLLLLRDRFPLGPASQPKVFPEGIISEPFSGALFLDHDGDLLSSSSPSINRENFSNAKYFTAQRNSRPDRLFISAPAQDLGSRSAVLAFSRKLFSPTGRFDGVVVLTVKADYFTEHYTDRLFGHYGFVGVEGADGVPRAGRSGTGNDVLRKPLLSSEQVAGRTSGTMSFDGRRYFADGHNRLVSWVPVPGYDLTALAGLDVDEALGAYWRYRDNRISGAWANSAWLAIATILAASFFVQIGWKRHQLEVTRGAYRLATEDAGDAFFIQRPLPDSAREIKDFEIVDCNRRGAELLGLHSQEVIGRCLGDLYSPELRGLFKDGLAEAWSKGLHESEIQIPGGERFVPKWVSYKAVRANGELAVTIRDISESKIHLLELERRSNEDPLTGLPNRNWIQHQLPVAIKRAQDRGTGVGVLFIDLDGFKTINDALGHAMGDELLRTVGQRLKIAVRPNDQVVRLGGDEFVVVVEDLAGYAGAEQVAERVIGAFRDPFRLQQATHVMSASIGISMFPEHGLDAEALLKNADIAMYSVKLEGKGRYRFFRPQFFETISTRLQTEMELRRAIERHELVVYYQPRVSLAAGKMSSMEALVRWDRPGKGITGPEAFIPLAEQTGLIAPLGEMVIDLVCAQLALWLCSGHQVVPVSVNVSPHQFSQTDVLQILVECTHRHGIVPSLLEVEVTESSMMQERLAESAVFPELRALGIKMCLDDFGTGYSSLAQLQRLRFDVLKIDRAFVVEIERQETETLISSMIAMAHALGMTVVAEGVETVRQMERLKKLGCDEGQGFYFSRPVPPGKPPCFLAFA